MQMIPIKLCFFVYIAGQMPSMMHEILELRKWPCVSVGWETEAALHSCKPNLTHDRVLTCLRIVDMAIFL